MLYKNIPGFSSFWRENSNYHGGRVNVSFRIQLWVWSSDQAILVRFFLWYCKSCFFFCCRGSGKSALGDAFPQATGSLMDLWKIYVIYCGLTFQRKSFHFFYLVCYSFKMYFRLIENLSSIFVFYKPEYVLFIPHPWIDLCF